MTSIESPRLKKSSLDLVYPRYMVFCVITGSLGFFCCGWVIGSPNLPGYVTHACENGLSHTANPLFPDCLPMNDALWGFAVASFCISGLIGGLSAGFLQTKLGRRKTVTLSSLGYILGGIVVGCSTSPSMFIAGRFLCGYSGGLGSLTLPVYASEISTVKARGVMGTINQLMTVTGILLSSIVGLPLSYVPLWRINYALVALPAIVQALTMPFCAESPRYLVSLNKIDEAKASLQKLRSDSCIQTELYGMVEGQLGTLAAINMSSKQEDYFESKLVLDQNPEHLTVHVDNAASEDYISTPPLVTPPPQYKQDASNQPIATPMNMIQIFRDTFIRRVALILIIILMLQQLIGINAVMYYSTTMFNTVFSPDMSKYMAIVCNVVNFLATVLSIVLVDRMGRRSLLLVSEGGACLFAILLTVGYVYHINALMVTSLFGYVIMFAVGVGPIPWILISELAPVNASSSVGAVATALNWAMNFLVGQCFPVIFLKIQGYSFILFAFIGFISFVFTYLQIPETKGRTVEDIAKEFRSKIQ
jgi:MFS family permease